MPQKFVPKPEPSPTDALTDEVKKLRAEVRALRKEVERWATWCELAVNRPWEQHVPPRKEESIPF